MPSKKTGTATNCLLKLLKISPLKFKIPLNGVNKIEYTSSEAPELFSLYPICPILNLSIFFTRLRQVILKPINALLLTFGFYNDADEFILKLYLLGENAVEGTLVAVLPKKLYVATWSTRLNKKKKSILEMEALEQWTPITCQSIF